MNDSEKNIIDKIQNQVSEIMKMVQNDIDRSDIDIKDVDAETYMHCSNLGGVAMLEVVSTYLNDLKRGGDAV